MRVIALDGRGWRSYDDFFNALLPALGAPDWHGRNYAALLDSISVGGINEVEPPYRIEISGARHMSADLLRFICELRADVERREREAVADRRPEVRVEIALDGDV